MTPVRYRAVLGRVVFVVGTVVGLVGALTAGPTGTRPRLGANRRDLGYYLPEST